MPKLLPNIRERLLARARELLAEQGYAALSIRGIARDCGVAAGTVYNYFKDKDSLAASVMLVDWGTCLEAVNDAARAAESPLPVLRIIHRELRVFAARYQALFRDEAAQRSFSAASRLYHGRLRASLADPLRRFFPASFLPEFIAEALLFWTLEGKSFEELDPILRKLCDVPSHGS